MPTLTQPNNICSDLLCLIAHLSHIPATACMLDDGDEFDASASLRNCKKHACARKSACAGTHCQLWHSACACV